MANGGPGYFGGVNAPGQDLGWGSMGGLGHSFFPGFYEAHTSTASYVLGGSFTPNNVQSATLQLWLDARVGITIATGVSSWADQSGNGNTFTQGTGANQPAFNASAINGFPGVVGAVGKSLAMAGNTIAQNAARTAYALLRIGTSSTPIWAPRALGYQLQIYPGAPPSFIETNGTTTNTSIGDTIVTATNHYLRWSFDGVQTNLLKFNMDGIEKTVANGVGTGVGAEPATTGEVLFSQDNGTIGVFLVYSGVVSAAEDAQVLAYLKGLGQL